MTTICVPVPSQTHQCVGVGADVFFAHPLPRTAAGAAARPEVLLPRWGSNIQCEVGGSLDEARAIQGSAGGCDPFSPSAPALSRCTPISWRKCACHSASNPCPLTPFLPPYLRPGAACARSTPCLRPPRPFRSASPSLLTSRPRSTPRPTSITCCFWIPTLSCWREICPMRIYTRVGKEG